MSTCTMSNIALVWDTLEWKGNFFCLKKWYMPHTDLVNEESTKWNLFSIMANLAVERCPNLKCQLN